MNGSIRGEDGYNPAMRKELCSQSFGLLHIGTDQTEGVYGSIGYINSSIYLGRKSRLLLQNFRWGNFFCREVKAGTSPEKVIRIIRRVLGQSKKKSPGRFDARRSDLF
jgi:hypothetical protein